MLRHFIAVAPIIPSLLGNKDVCVWATNKVEYVFYKEYGRLQLPIKEGNLLSAEGTPMLTMKQNKQLSRIVPKDVYGITFHSICIPVEEGTVGLSVSIEDKNNVIESIDSLSAMAQQVSATTLNISENASTISETVNTVSQLSHRSSLKRKELDQITAMMVETTNRLRMLSLNAMIEATRSGKYGRSFTVVANEVKQLAEANKDKLEDVKAVIFEVSQLISKTDDEMRRIKHLTVDQTAATMEIADAIQSVSKSTESLQQLAEKLL